ncbi:MAG: hypothetical protein WC805_00530 [Patescibacteria group bacterium]|jgi:hypothetical protein
MPGTFIIALLIIFVLAAVAVSRGKKSRKVSISSSMSTQASFQPTPTNTPRVVKNWKEAPRASVGDNLHRKPSSEKSITDNATNKFKPTSGYEDAIDEQLKKAKKLERGGTGGTDSLPKEVAGDNPKEDKKP